MIIVNFSLLLVFLCSFFIVVCSILNKIKIYPCVKGVLCVSMLSIIGVWTGKFHPYSNTALDIFYIALAYLVARRTYISYQRGYF